jgi:hypothetical protein
LHYFLSQEWHHHRHHHHQHHHQHFADQNSYPSIKHTHVVLQTSEHVWYYTNLVYYVLPTIPHVSYLICHSFTKIYPTYIQIKYHKSGHMCI